MIENLHVILSVVNQLDGQTFRRVEEKLNMMGAILITCMNSCLCLLVNRIRKLVPCRANEVLVKKIRLVLLERFIHSRPGLKIIADCSGFGLIFQRPWALQLGSVDTDLRLGGSHA